MQVAFPFKWDIETAKLPKMKRLAAHRTLADTYGNGWGDAVTRICREVDAGRLTREPVFDSAKAQELKLESICVAGGKATVSLPQRTAE